MQRLSTKLWQNWSERQIEHGLSAVSSGEIRRTYWDRDFYFGLEGIVRERFDSGRVYQQAETFEDLPRVQAP